MKVFTIFLVFFSFLFLTACVPSWSVVGKNPIKVHDAYTIQAPSDWRKLKLDDRLILTPESPEMASLVLDVYPGKLKFQFTKRVFNSNMLPEEVAELVIDNYSLNPSNQNFKLISNEPAVINNYDGFRIQFEYKSTTGVPVSVVVVGFMQKDRLFTIEYEALKRVYFDKYLASFEKILASVK